MQTKQGNGEHAEMNQFETLNNQWKPGMDAYQPHPCFAETSARATSQRQPQVAVHWAPSETQPTQNWYNMHTIESLPGGHEITVLLAVTQRTKDFSLYIIIIDQFNLITHLETSLPNDPYLTKW